MILSVDERRIKTSAEYTSENPHVVNEIVDHDLCVRCGACEPACPVDIIRFDDQAYPYITQESACVQSCTRCLKVCPGEEVPFNLFDDELFGERPHPQSVTGVVRGAYVTFAIDDAVRKAGTSGGFVTQLLAYMIEKEIIDGALVLTAAHDPEKGWYQKPVIARSVEEIRQAAKSKYLVAPVLTELGEIEKVEGNYAIVALPCYVHAIRKYMKVSPKLRQRVKFIIGLYCNVALEPYAFTDICEMKGVKPKDITSFDFRYGEWPGGVHAAVSNGTPVKVHKHEEMKDEFNTLKIFYTPPRCNLCIDFSAEHADIAVGDPWLRGPDGEFMYQDGRTTLLTRTDIGVQIVADAVRDGYISVEEIPIETYMVNFEKSARYKRDLVPKSIALRKKRGLRSPEYHRTLIEADPSYWYLRKAIKAHLVGLVMRHKWCRKLGLRLAQTRPMILYLRWNRGRKARRFARGYPEALAQVARLRKSVGGSA